MNIPRLTALQGALLASAAVHAAVLTVRFVDPMSLKRLFDEAPLEVVLVNARSNERPGAFVISLRCPQLRWWSSNR